MELLVLSFLFGILTVFSPCVLPVLPTILGGTVRNDSNSKLRPYVIILSLSVSVILFSIIIKGPFDLLLGLGVTQVTNILQVISGIIIFLFGIVTIFPEIWENISLKLGFGREANTLMEKAANRDDFLGDILLGAALGPVFTSCSPTYALIISAILPQSFVVGLLNLVAYTLGLSVTMLAVAILGQKFIGKTKWLADPDSTFKKVLGLIFVILGLAIATGLIKDVEAWLITQDSFKLINFESEVLRERGLM